MNTAPTPGPTDIELYLRETASPTEYTLRERLVDYWAGRADRRYLSTNQAKPRTDDEVIETVPLTPWAVARRNEYRASKDLETITHNRIVDPLRTEKATLQARIPRLKEAVGIAQEEAGTAEEAAREIAAAPAAEAVPRGPGEQQVDQAGLARRRGREKEARDAAAAAAAQAAAAAAQASAAAHAAAIERLAVIGERLTLAQSVLDDRVAECRRYTSRRINVYARAITRRHPDAPVIAELTEHLDLDQDAPRPNGSQTGGSPVRGSQPWQGRPSWLSVVDPEPETP
ncbi:hypothetical protein DM793_04040 [Paenarthrobacter nitroguajacolicus]|uniref:hypothetical protein n=1 Tax=Paenarthrobacter nitroguajacolicus TaxID=211146 RepID=UPI0015C03B40|nr:hypothetical protein [Paenarthrobacter nitroguajacolicus]NWL10269.1 hypothetical protein [Paenarthrobacter nitroguajacolicus]NWL10473.1 hypothetical protein [Paenarthrobacter nitroguajacolicus]